MASSVLKSLHSTAAGRLMRRCRNKERLAGVGWGGNNRCNVLRGATVHSAQWRRETFLRPRGGWGGAPPLMWRVNNLGFQKGDTFRWTFQAAQINFNRLKILIFPANNQRNFPSQPTSQSKCVGSGGESGAGGDLMRFTVRYTAFCRPLYI